jgi:hypothetical protein
MAKIDSGYGGDEENHGRQAKTETRKKFKENQIKMLIGN